MSTYNYQYWLYQQGNAPLQFLEFGGHSLLRWYFDPLANQIYLQNTSLDTNVAICYSGEASIPEWEGKFESGEAGAMSTIAPGKIAYINNGNPTQISANFSLPNMVNTYIRCDRFVVISEAEPNTIYKFNFEIEPVGEAANMTAIMMVGDKLVNGASNDP